MIAIREYINGPPRIALKVIDSHEIERLREISMIWLKSTICRVDFSDVKENLEHDYHKLNVLKSNIKSIMTQVKSTNLQTVAQTINEQYNAVEKILNLTENDQFLTQVYQKIYANIYFEFSTKYEKVSFGENFFF